MQLSFSIVLTIEYTTNALRRGCYHSMHQWYSRMSAYQYHAWIIWWSLWFIKDVLRNIHSMKIEGYMQIRRLLSVVNLLWCQIHKCWRFINLVARQYPRCVCYKNNSFIYHVHSVCARHYSIIQGPDPDLSNFQNMYWINVIIGAVEFPELHNT